MEPQVSYPHRWTLAENGPRCLPTPHLLCHLLEAPSVKLSRGTTSWTSGQKDCPWHPGKAWQKGASICGGWSMLIIWVCLKIGYIPNYSHLIGIMIMKTIGFRGTLFSDTPIDWPQPIQHPSTHRTQPVGRRGFTLRFRDQSPRASMLKPPTVLYVFWVRIFTRNEKMDCLRPNKHDQFGSEWHVAPSQLMFWVWGTCGLRQYTYKQVWQRTNDCWKWYWNQQTWK